MISVFELLSGFIFFFVYDLTFIVIARHLFCDKLIIDRITIILMTVDALVSPVLELIDYHSTVLSAFDTAVSYGTLLIATCRGNPRTLFRRLRAVFDAFLIFGFSVSLYCAQVYILLFPETDIYAVEFMNDFRYKCYTAFICIIFLGFLYTQLVKKELFLNFGWRTRLLLISFSVFILFCSEGVFYITDRKNSVLLPFEINILIILGLTIIYIVVPGFIVKNQTSTLFETGQKHHQEMLELETRHFQKYRDAQDETRRFRHDILNNLLTVQTLQKQGKNSEAADYIDQLLGQVSELSPKVVTGSDMLDTIISSKLDTMEESGICYAIDGVFDHGLNMKSVDMCTVFANALDNAIEACEKTDGKRTFEMRIKRTASFYVVNIKNSMSETSVPKSGNVFSRFTTKENRAFHGYGLGNIKKTVEKYGGETTVSIENNMFQLNILLPVA